MIYETSVIAVNHGRERHEHRSRGRFARRSLCGADNFLRAFSNVSSPLFLSIFLREASDLWAQWPKSRLVDRTNNDACRDSR